MDAAIAEAKEDNLGEFIYCDMGKVGDLDVVVTHNELDGARVELWSDDRSDDIPDFSLNPHEVSATRQLLLTAKFAIKMLNKRS